jgi:hypothetical protein
MTALDRLLDEQPILAEEYIKLDIRNQQAHYELQSFNDTQRFANVHPLVVDKTYRTAQGKELRELKRKNPEGFLNEITNLTQNIRRIESNINKKKYKSSDELLGWQQNLARAKIRQEIITQILNE